MSLKAKYGELYDKKFLDINCFISLQFTRNGNLENFNLILEDVFSKEESRQLKQLFWTSFGKSFPTKWVLYNTKIKGFSFKFHFDNKSAHVSLDLEDDLENRINYWEKLQQLKTIITTEFLPDAIFEEVYFLDNGKEISRIYVPLEHKVSIHNKNTWQEVMVFLNDKMNAFEAFYYEYEDFLKA